ncbi:kinase-like domain-containing protein [Podospora appendiculata]|uniref:non-specific serine/threonine protein kinase n=1 Tax=Podospora appendiculata TaxID=314037 RepID=A0AAE0XCS0_9PEZI|nr:kinase-like domain-containing protein [Podospora appendiculata]
MSLIPYHPREGREIVLRHHDAIVVRDPSSQRLEIRGIQLSECPTCHQPWRSSSSERNFDGPDQHDSYVNPEYFRMLRHGRIDSPSRPPSSPIRRLVQPVHRHDVSDRNESQSGLNNAEFVSSSPAPGEGSRIRRDAFSPNYFNNFFVEERELGRGGKGVVLLVRHEIDGCQLGHFACKRVPVGDDHAWLEKVLVEVELLAKLSHPNLVSYRHVWLENMQFNRFGPSVVCAFILQQYCNSGDLLHYVIGDVPKEATKEQLKAQMRRRSKGQLEPPQGLFPAHRRLPFDEIYRLFRDITSGLAYLHAANYIHRDLKPSNCLLHREGNQLVCLISDFGEVQPENVARKSTGSTGTISYCAPEVLVKEATGRYGNFTAKSDIFSLGMILYFMCFGRLPYQSANTVHEELEDIDLLRAEITEWKGFQDERRERPDLPSKVYQLLKRLLAVSPAERPSANEVLGAMKSDPSMEGVTRGASSSTGVPSVGLAGRRIQNLDSPLPPSTPKSADISRMSTDPTKHARVTSSSDEDLPSPYESDSPQATTQNVLQKHITPPSNMPRHRGHNHAHPLSLSHSQDGYARGGSHSPERPKAPNDATGSPAAITTPLLMPPPTTRMEQMRHLAVLTQYQAIQWLRDTGTSSGSILRLALLGLKIFSLSWFCWPYSSNLGVLGSVFTLAALDLWRPGSIEGVQGVTGSRGDMAMLRAGQFRHEDSALGRWLSGWRRSCVLLALHFLVLWVTSRLGALCAAAQHEKWTDW